MNLEGSIKQIDNSTVAFNLQLDGKSIASFTVSSNASLSANPTALISAFLPIAAKLGYNLHLSGEVDEEAVANAEQAMGLLASWHNNLSSVSLVGCTTTPGESIGRCGVACLASLGLDSLYSLQAKRKDITHMVLCRGFDIGLANDTLWEKTVTTCREIAAAENKELVEISTDIREASDKYLHWQSQYIGAAIATIGQLLDRHFSQLLIPSSYDSGAESVWGTHSRLDPLWSSSRLTLVHHPRNVNRVEKMRAMANNPFAIKYLRVCNQNQNEFNCGKCEKCVRTICNALAVGAGDNFQTLAVNNISPQDIANMPLWPSKIEFHEENLTYMRKLPDSQRMKSLEAALEARIATCKAETPPLAHLRRSQPQVSI